MLNGYSLNNLNIEYIEHIKKIDQQGKCDEANTNFGDFIIEYFFFCK